MPCLRLIALAWLLLPVWTAAAQPVAGGVNPDEKSRIIAQVRSAAESALREQFPGDFYRFDVRVVRTGGDLNPEAATRIVLPQAAALPRAHTQVDVLQGDGASGYVKTGWALLYVAHFDSVMTAQTTLKPGAAVSPSDVGAAWMETTRFHGDPLRPADFARLQAQGQAIATRYLREGGALRSADLRAPYAADTGEAVLMRYRRGRVLLHFPCKAREPGYLDDTIRLHSSETGATYRARLTGPGAAEWIETL